MEIEIEEYVKEPCSLSLKKLREIDDVSLKPKDTKKKDFNLDNDTYDFMDLSQFAEPGVEQKYLREINISKNKIKSIDILTKFTKLKTI